MNIAVLISGTGTNLKALLEAKKAGEFDSDISLIISNRNAEGLKHGRDNHIDTFVIKDDEEMLKKLEGYNIDFVVLAGYLRQIPEFIVKKYKNRIINIHPALLPKYGGKGYYGMRVHEEVFKNKDEVSGATVHYVNEELDKGNIILQREIDISDAKSPREIKDRVLEVEHKILKDAIKKIEVNNK
ncbi:phosphoribosylglycinamide formyltransferase [Peptoniphilus sp. ING2-D1G]|nr:phosphoribosylglycinamide formyltransferase [Peptoniphilus sp. ING2-D1G]